VSIDAGAVREGVLVTHALRTGHHQLALNAAVDRGGYLQVEVTDEDENVLDGCSREQCDPFTGDATRHVVTWQGRPGLPHHGTLRLRFFMRSASLYAFAFV
jgi:hypothetical protein